MVLGRGRYGLHFLIKNGVGGFEIKPNEVGLDSKFVLERLVEWCSVVRTNRPALPPRGGISRNIVRLLEGGLEFRGGVLKNSGFGDRRSSNRLVS